MTIEPNDTFSQAINTGLFFSGTFTKSTEIGDNPKVNPTDDVDLFEFQLAAGDLVNIDIDADEFSSDLDSVLRLFNSEGQEVAVSDDTSAPGEDFSLDSFIWRVADSTDTYFAGVSSFANFDYDPLVKGSGSGFSTGEYDITIEIFQNAIDNGSFETGTFEDWRTIGDTSIVDSEFGVTPTQGHFQALLTNDVSASGGSVEAEDLEEFLDLAPGVLDGLGNGNITEGSAIKQTFDIDEPSILSFDWNFLTNEATPTFFNDFAFFTVDPFTLELADTGFPVFFSSDSEFNEETGYQNVSVALSEPGTYTLSFGVVDLIDEVVDSALLVDNISVFPISVGSASPSDPFTFGLEGNPVSESVELPKASELETLIAERAIEI